MRIGGLLLLLVALSALPAPAQEVYLAPLEIEDEMPGMAEGLRPEEDLLQALETLGTGASLTAVLAPAESGDAPHTLLEAIAFCERLGYPFLLYGYVRRGVASYSAELKLLDRRLGRIATVLFGSDDPAHYDRLMREMAAKLLQYFDSEAGLTKPPAAAAAERNLVELWTWAGYWTPAGGEWGRVLAGVASAGLGVRFIPVYPLFRPWARPAYLSMGLDAEYALGMNEPGYESFFLHQARLRIPVDLVLELGGGHAAGIGAGLSVQLDTATQDRKYSPSFRGTTAAPGLCLSALYRYSPSARISFGLAGLMEVAAYSPVLFSFSPRLFFSFAKGNRHE